MNTDQIDNDQMNYVWMNNEQMNNEQIKNQYGISLKFGQNCQKMPNICTKLIEIIPKSKTFYIKFVKLNHKIEDQQ